MVRAGVIVATLLIVAGCGREPTPYTPPVVLERETVCLPGLGDCVVLDDNELQQLAAQVNRFSEYGAFKGSLRSELSDFTVRQVVVRLKALGWQAPRDFTVRVTAYPMSTAKMAVNGGQSGLQLDGTVQIIAGWATPGGEAGTVDVVRIGKDCERTTVACPPKKTNHQPSSQWTPQPILSGGSEIPASFGGSKAGK
jgi:hypothetical protein